MREETKNALYAYVLGELSAMKEKVCENYEDNARERQRNQFLVFENPDIKKFMGLGRSIDSQLGNRIQNIIFYLARIRYGDASVPNIINICMDEMNLKANVYTYYFSGKFDKRCFKKGYNPCQQKIYINGSIDDEKAKELLKLKKSASELMGWKHYQFNLDRATLRVFKTITISKCPVDLCVIDTNSESLKIHTFEIKLSGNLDTKNAESNANEVERLKKLFLFTGNNQSYFASCYGECSSAVRTKVSDKALLTSSSVLNAEEFWNFILPVNEEALGFPEFIELYERAFRESGLENRILTL